MGDTLINKSKVRNFVLENAKERKKLNDGSPRFTRVSKEFLDAIEADLRTNLRNKIDRLPSHGRTV